MSAGSPDPTFGTGGAADLGANGQESELFSAVATQPDGKTVVAIENAGHASALGVIVTRLLANGTPDLTFSSVYLGNGYSDIYAGVGPIFVNIEADGKILVGSTSVIARLNTNGTLDKSFANGTGQITNIHDVEGMAVQADGKILVGFNPYYAPPPSLPNDTKTQVARLNANGSLDATYGTGGYATLVAPAAAAVNGIVPDLHIGGLALDASGRAVVGLSMAGQDATNTYQTRLGITRLTTSGAVDATFATGGFTLDPVVTDRVASSIGVVIAPATGVIYQAANYDEVFGGRALSGVLYSYSSDGKLVAPSGAAASPAVLAGVEGIALQPDGKVLVSGYDFGAHVALPAGDAYANVVDRFLPAAPGQVTTPKLDPTFGSGGTALFDGATYGDAPYGTQNAVATAPDGRVVLSGEDFNSRNQFAFRLTGDTATPLLAGTPIGTAGSFQNKGNTIANVFDGNANTFFDAPTANGTWAGLDLGAPRSITQIEFAPRPGWAARMVGGQFKGSNAADFSSGVVTLYTVTNAPVSGSLTTVSVNLAAGPFRYVRYIGPAGSFGNIAEAQFISGGPARIAGGSVIGTAGSFQNQGNTIAKAFDGNLNTFVDGPTPSGNFVGMDFDQPVAVTQVRFAPRAGWANRMVGGMIQASTTADFSTGVITVYTISSAPPVGTLTTVALPSVGQYQYWRYIGPNGSFGNIAELEFDA